ncbi:MAG TPA: GDSL-type esterase/lipase family protein [Edaphobacter sp.]|nr:GDSL-type esterase/lipase family protein [Edaphobacter sp.]
MGLRTTWLLLSTVSTLMLTSCGSGLNDSFFFNPSLNATTVFMGDSITQRWPLPDHNQGISGETTAQMLVRFNADVIGYGYKRVVILGGTNDTARNPFDPSDVSHNIDAMSSMAQSAGMEVVLCTIPPVFGSSLHNERVISANQAIIALATAKGFLLVDYFSSLNGHPEDFVDGIHPNTSGYTVMERTLAETVTQ